MAYSAGNPAFFWYSFAAGRETAVISVTGIRLDSSYKKGCKSVTYLSFYLYKINCCCVLTCSIFLHPCLIHSEAKTSNLGIAFCFCFWNRNFISLLLSFYFLVSSCLVGTSGSRAWWLCCWWRTWRRCARGWRIRRSRLRSENNNAQTSFSSFKNTYWHRYTFK